MSIILKGIDMPKEGEHILALIKNDGKCSYFEETALTRIMKTTEAIQIDRPHGRLIDADALETVFKDMAKCEWNQKVSPISWAYAFEDTIDEIYDAPTILEAEE